MKKLLALALIGTSLGALAQNGANNNSASSATTSALGNNQAVTFQSTSPSDLTTNSTITSTNTQNVNSSGTTTGIIDYKGSYTVKNVPSVGGPNLTTSNDTCMGSSSGSANGPGIGISFGTTWTDEQCKRLKMSRELWNKGMKAASLAMDCMDPAALSALEITGTKCPQSMTAEERVAAFGLQASSVGAVPSVAAATPGTSVALAAPALTAVPAPIPAPVPAPSAVPAPAVAVTPVSVPGRGTTTDLDAAAYQDGIVEFAAALAEASGIRRQLALTTSDTATSLVSTTAVRQ